MKLVHFPQNSILAHPWAQRYGLFLKSTILDIRYAKGLSNYTPQQIAELENISAVSQAVGYQPADTIPAHSKIFPDPFYFEDGNDTWLGAWVIRPHGSVNLQKVQDEAPIDGTVYGYRYWLKNAVNESRYQFEPVVSLDGGFNRGNRYAKQLDTLNSYAHKATAEMRGTSYFAKNSAFAKSYQETDKVIIMETGEDIEAVNHWHFNNESGATVRKSTDYLPYYPTETIPAGTTLIGNIYLVRDNNVNRFWWLVQATINGETLLYWVPLHEYAGQLHAPGNSSATGTGYLPARIRQKTGNYVTYIYPNPGTESPESWYLGIKDQQSDTGNDNNDTGSTDSDSGSSFRDTVDELRDQGKPDTETEEEQEEDHTTVTQPNPAKPKAETILKIATIALLIRKLII